DRLTFRNESSHEVAHIVAIEVGPAWKGETQLGRYNVVSGVGAGERRGSDKEMSGLLGGRRLQPWSSEQVSLKGDLTKILVGRGMNQDEAQAMVATWTRSWFATEGLRILYVVPRPLV